MVRGSNAHEEFFLTPRLGKIVYNIFLIIVMSIPHFIYDQSYLIDTLQQYVFGEGDWAKLL